MWAITFLFILACTRLYNPLCPSVGRSIGPHFTFLQVLFLWPHCSCIGASAHPKATTLQNFYFRFGEGVRQADSDRRARNERVQEEAAEQLKRRHQHYQKHDQSQDGNETTL